jgi:hypothetical protein
VSRYLFAVIAIALSASAVTLGIGSPAQSAVTVGYVGPSYTGTTAPTGQKPQSKLWVAAGIWWGSLWDKDSRRFNIFRYDWSANRWINTRVLVDERANSNMDALWDGVHLYIASAGPGPSTVLHSPRITRYSFNSQAKTWSRDAGYPVRIGTGGVEAVVLAKDSKGLLWVSHTYGPRVWVTHSRPGDDRSWVPAYQLPTPNGESTVTTDDVSAIVGYDGTRIGVLWSNQRTETVYFASHLDGTSDRSWVVQVAYRQPKGADDHLNIKSLTGDASGRVFAVAKTSMSGSNDPLINLLVLKPGGQWTSRPVFTVADQATRAMVLIDQTHRLLYVFAAAPCCAGGRIYYKRTSLTNPSFAPGRGATFIAGDAHPELNNPTSTKQNLSASTGLVVLAGDDETRTYMYNRISLR